MFSQAVSTVMHVSESLEPLIDDEEIDMEKRASQTRRSVLKRKFYSSSIKTVVTIVSLLLTAHILWYDFPSQLLDSAYDEDGLPLATTINGTYRGIYNEKYHQDIFLGMPYAIPPIGNLRFRQAKPTNESWEIPRDAMQFGPQCLGYGPHNSPYPMSEDCLTINVIRPSRVKTAGSLPVGVFIYGGGGYGGGSNDPRYNMTFLVSHAASVGLPFIAVTLNYRGSVWGFMSSEEIMGTGNSNLGLHDQRLALQWVQSNIAAFGGDPTKVTLWGGSSGAVNVGLHLMAHGGRDDGLFRAAILQSGSPVATTSLKGAAQKMYDTMIADLGCRGAVDKLDCLRNIPSTSLQSFFNQSYNDHGDLLNILSTPDMDGSFINQYGSLNLKNSRFVKVPIMSGTVSHEGNIWIPDEISSWEALRAYLKDYYQPKEVVDKLLSLYPEEIKAHEVLSPPIGSITEKSLFNRVERVFADLHNDAGHVLTCDSYTREASCYNFRFDGIPAGRDVRQGVPHGAEIAPLFQNVDGLGFEVNPFEGKGDGYYEMSRLMGTMWAGFITSLDPSIGLKRTEMSWPEYSAERPQRFVFREDRPSGMEDIHRSEAISYINEIQHSVFGK